jgi:hypothetical protein
VLNVDLLPTSIDTVVIGHRLFSLPMQVESLEGNDLNDIQMDVDDGNFSDGHNMEGRKEGPSAANESQGQGNHADANTSSQPHGSSNNDKQVDDSVAGETIMEDIQAVITAVGEGDNSHKMVIL